MNNIKLVLLLLNLVSFFMQLSAHGLLEMMCQNLNANLHFVGLKSFHSC